MNNLCIIIQIRHETIDNNSNRYVCQKKKKKKEILNIRCTVKLDGDIRDEITWYH